jgi:hypothetical protein
VSHSPDTLFQPVTDPVESLGMVEPPVTSAAEQTRLPWARLVRSADELPAVYRPFMEALPTEGVFP